MNQALTPHYAQELRRVRRRKSMRQLRWVVIGLTAGIGLPVAVLILLGMMGY